MNRKAQFAGKFYESSPEALQKQLEAIWPATPPTVAPCLGALVPHAGYGYSGRVAAQVYARLPQAQVYVLLGPNHTGHGEAIAVATAGRWETPLGSVRINSHWAGEFLNHCPEAKWDDEAHEGEHSLEVQLPFLQKSGNSISIVCIALSTWDVELLGRVGKALADTARVMYEKTIFLASSDMNHFADLETTRRLDRLALSRFVALDPAALLKVVEKENISMCGAAPAAAMLFAAQRLGATACDAIAYATSAEASGDTQRVVGYAGMIVR
jgi:MEMO1 family protein